MTRVLVAWEFGGGMGHLTAVAALAARFAARGATVGLAVPNPAMAKPLVKERLSADEHVEVIQGVGWRVRNDLGDKDPGKVATLTLGDVMMLFGWDHAERVGPRVRAWESIADRFHPDAVVADFAPTMRLALQGKLPFHMIGTGYSMPPAGRLLPPLRPWHSEVTAYSRRNEFNVMGEINRIRAALKMPAVDYLADLFHGDSSYPCTLDLFDPYAAYRGAPTLPPHNVEPIACGPVLDARPARALVHLPVDHPLLRPLLNALDRMGFVADLVARGSVSALPDDLPASTHVHQRYVDLTKQLPAVRLAVHHGGLGLAFAGAMAGTPQLMITKNLEHQITAQALVDRGCALSYSVEDRPTEADLATAVDALVTGNAQSASRSVAAEMPRDCGLAILDRIVDEVYDKVQTPAEPTLGDVRQ